MSGTDDKPLMYTDRRSADAERDKYLFISYSHKDSDFVYADLHRLYDAGLKYWYDNSLMCGEEWNKVALTRLKSDNCMGVIFYMSTNMLSSEACMKEVMAFEEIRAERPDFIFKIVSVGNRSVLQHVQTFFVQHSESDNKELSGLFPQERLVYMLSVFKSNIIYLGKKTPEDFSHLDKMIGELSRFSLFSNDESSMEKLIGDGTLTNVGKSYKMEFGSYPQSMDDDVRAPFNDGIFTVSDKKYMACDRKVFAFEPIRWSLLSLDGNEIKLISDKCLEVSRGDSYIQWLNTEFKQTAFTAEEREKFLKDIEIMSQDDLKMHGKDISRTECTDYSSQRLSGTRMIMLWLDDDIPGVKKKVCASLDNMIIQRGMPVTATAGLRPIITIDIDNIE